MFYSSPNWVFGPGPRIKTKREIQANLSVSPSKKPRKLGKKIPASKVRRLLGISGVLAAGLFLKLSQGWQFKC